MNPLATKSIKKDSHKLELKVFSNFLLVQVLMPEELYYKITEELGYGGWEAERYAIHKFKKGIFTIDYSSIKIFDNSKEFYNEMKKFNYDEGSEESNSWFNTVIFPIIEDNFESDLNTHIEYVKLCSSKYENESMSGKIKIANNILNKFK